MAESDWQLNKNGKLKMGSLIRFPGDTDPFGTVVHVTESEALVKRFDTGKREPMSLRSEVEWRLPGDHEEEEKAVKPKKDKDRADKKDSTDKKEKKAAASKPVNPSKPSKPKKEKRPKVGEPEPELEDVEIENEETTPEEEEKRVSKKEKAKPANEFNWYSAEQLSATTGHNPAWIGKNREEMFQPGMYRTDTEAEGRGRKPIVYNADALEILKNTPIPTRGGGRRKAENEDGGSVTKPTRPKKPGKKIEQRELFTAGEETPTPKPSKGRKKSASVVDDPASTALDAIEAAITAAEHQRDAHAQRYETLIAGLRQHKADLEFLASGLAG